MPFLTIDKSSKKSKNSGTAYLTEERKIIIRDEYTMARNPTLEAVDFFTKDKEFLKIND